MKKHTLLLIVLALSGVGCAKSVSTMRGMDAMGSVEFGGESAAEFAEDEEYAFDADDSAGLSRSVMASPAPAAPNVARTGDPTISIDKADASDPQPLGVARRIVYTAAMAVAVFDMQGAHDGAEALTERHGGWVARMDRHELVLKIPSKNLRAAMDEIGEMGVTEARTLESNDVSDRYFDLQTRIAVLEKTQVQMMALMAKARDVTEALNVRKSLDQITMELEVLKAELHKLKNHVSFSTLTLTLLERGPGDAVPSSNDPFPWVDELGVESTEWR